MTAAPANPAGEFAAVEEYDEALRREWTNTIRTAPAKLREAVAGLSDQQLDTKYRNWTVRQIANHLVDSHLNSVVRFKLALTENEPRIKPYLEAKWVEIEDAVSGDLEPTLQLMDGLHAKWVQLLEVMTPQQFQCTFFHPEVDGIVNLWTALNSYAWHCRHHTGQIHWLREHRF